MESIIKMLDKVLGPIGKSMKIFGNALDAIETKLAQFTDMLEEYFLPTLEDVTDFAALAFMMTDQASVCAANSNGCAAEEALEGISLASDPPMVLLLESFVSFLFFFLLS